MYLTIYTTIISYENLVIISFAFLSHPWFSFKSVLYTAAKVIPLKLGYGHPILLLDIILRLPTAVAVQYKLVNWAFQPLCALALTHSAVPLLHIFFHISTIQPY